MNLVEFLDSLLEPEVSPNKILEAHGIPYTITAELCMPLNLNNYSIQ